MLDNGVARDNSPHSRNAPRGGGGIGGGDGGGYGDGQRPAFQYAVLRASVRWP